MGLRETETYNKFIDLLKNECGYADELESGDGEVIEEMLNYGTLAGPNGKRIPGKPGRDLREREWDIAQLLMKGEPLYVYKKGDKFPTKIQYNSATGKIEMDDAPITEKPEPEEVKKPSLLWRFFNLIPRMFGMDFPSVKKWKDYVRNKEARENITNWFRVERRENYYKLLDERAKEKQAQKAAEQKAPQAAQQQPQVQAAQVQQQTPSVQVQQNVPQNTVNAPNVPVSPNVQALEKQLSDLKAQQAVVEQQIAQAKLASQQAAQQQAQQQGPQAGSNSAGELDALINQVQADGTKLSPTAIGNIWSIHNNAVAGKQMLQDAVNDPTLKAIAGGEAVQAMVAYENLKKELTGKNKQQTVAALNDPNAARDYQTITRLSKEVVNAADYPHDKAFFEANFLQPTGLAQMAAHVEDAERRLVNESNLFGINPSDPFYKPAVEAEKMAMKEEDIQNAAAAHEKWQQQAEEAQTQKAYEGASEGFMPMDLTELPKVASANPGTSLEEITEADEALEDIDTEYEKELQAERDLDHAGWQAEAAFVQAERELAIESGEYKPLDPSKAPQAPANQSRPLEEIKEADEALEDIDAEYARQEQAERKQAHENWQANAAFAEVERDLAVSSGEYHPLDLMNGPAAGEKKPLDLDVIKEEDEELAAEEERREAQSENWRANAGLAEIERELAVESGEYKVLNFAQAPQAPANQSRPLEEIKEADEALEDIDTEYARQEQAERDQSQNQGSGDNAPADQKQAPTGPFDILMDNIQQDGTQLSDVAKGNLWQLYIDAQIGKQQLEEAINDPNVERLAGGEAVQAMVAFENMKTELSSGNKQQTIQNLGKENAAKEYQKITKISKDVVYAADYTHDKEFFQKNFLQEDGLSKMSQSVDNSIRTVVARDNLFGTKTKDPLFRPAVEAEKMAQKDEEKRRQLQKDQQIMPRL